MLLIHQSGSVKVGEVVRYTVTYSPARDRVLPTPEHLHLKVTNTAAIPLRAAWVHGPYALHVGAYPATFNPHCKVEDPEGLGAPQYEPMVKAGGSWSCKLRVPDCIRVGRDGKRIETAEDGEARRARELEESQKEQDKDSVTWIVEIASQILFSNSASVGYELLIGRDERGLDLGFAAVAAQGHGGPGHLKEERTDKDREEARRKGNVYTEGVYSRAIKLVVEDTETLWDKPELPTWEDGADKEKTTQKKRKRRKIHLVILTHGLHSNIGADMLFLKESIDATVMQARVHAKERKKKERAQKSSSSSPSPGDGAGQETSTAPLSGGQEELDEEPDESDDEEQTIVRGFTGNAIRTENGIQYLGKRLAKYILRFTYPDQPFLPIKKSFSKKLSDSFLNEVDRAKRDGKAAHHHSSIHHPMHGKDPNELPYTFTSISFIGHSLGGLIQTYAIAYIQKHAPHFFEQIKPVNFICMASPMLGLSNENPMYVKFALDFGLVGRTGQDLGLTWRPPTMARNGWNALLEGFGGLGGNGNSKKEEKKEDAAAKPLLRVLPSGPAHTVLKLFRNRTVYSNVVNDGIVPLRTSCLLFLDWRGLGKVEKARRGNGLIGTMAEWGWAELTGQNSSSIQQKMTAERYSRDGAIDDDDDDDSDNVHVKQGEGETVPQPAEDETAEDNRRPTDRVSLEREMHAKRKASSSSLKKQSDSDKGVLDTFLGWLRPTNSPKQPYTPSKKQTKAFRRAQTLQSSPSNLDSGDESTTEHDESPGANPTIRPSAVREYSGKKDGEHKRPLATRGDSLNGTDIGDVLAPPKTSIFESAGDLLHPPLPSRQWINDPSTRSRTIFHDRVYHPEDIPPPPMKRAGSRLQLRSPDSSADGSPSPAATKIDTGSMKVEEKIARAYHKDLSWRKVLVRLEPDAHNNMIVRRMFANAYGWPVIKHLCDTHFADTYAAQTRDEDEPARERAPPLDEPVPADVGEEVREQTATKVHARSQSEMREARDELADLHSPKGSSTGLGTLSRMSSTRSAGSDTDKWDDSFLETSDGEDSDAVDERNLVARILNPNSSAKKPAPGHGFPREESTPPKKIVTPPGSPGFTDGHRGLAPISPSTPMRPGSRRKSNSSTTTVSPQLPKRALVKSTFDTSDLEGPIIANRLVEEPDQLRSPPAVLSPGSTAEVGLRSNAEEASGGSLPALGRIISGGKKGVEGDRDTSKKADAEE